MSLTLRMIARRGDYPVIVVRNAQGGVDREVPLTRAQMLAIQSRAAGTVYDPAAHGGVTEEEWRRRGTTLAERDYAQGDCAIEGSILHVELGGVDDRGRPRCLELSANEYTGTHPNITVRANALSRTFTQHPDPRVPRKGDHRHLIASVVNGVAEFK